MSEVELNCIELIPLSWASLIQVSHEVWTSEHLILKSSAYLYKWPKYSSIWRSNQRWMHLLIQMLAPKDQLLFCLFLASQFNAVVCKILAKSKHCMYFPVIGAIKRHITISFNKHRFADPVAAVCVCASISITHCILHDNTLVQSSSVQLKWKFHFNLFHAFIHSSLHRYSFRFEINLVSF